MKTKDRTKSRHLLRDEHLDAIYAAFLVVYAIHGRLQAIEHPIGARDGGIQAYETFKTCVGDFRLPAIAKPSVLVRKVTNQILVEQKLFQAKDVKSAIFDMIALSFSGIKQPKTKQGFREAFNRFKESSQ